jgi:chitodextrinase
MHHSLSIFRRSLHGAAALCLLAVSAFGQGLIIDHTKTTITQIPAAAIVQAKQTLRIAYGHTSHGSQVTDGMGGLVAFMNRNQGDAFPDNLFTFNNGGTSGALDYRDYYGNFGGVGIADDLGAPNRTAWATATRTYLAAHPEVNVIMWSWCGQVDGSQADIQSYLSLMTQLETDFPGVRFVYMTGHLNGGGAAGNVNVRNNQIRDYCRTNNKTLFDFADIESYDPDGLVNYMALNCDDGCNYTSGGVGHNWASEWQARHTVNVDWYACGAAHSLPLSANRKAYAAWYLWARLAGWAGPNPDTTAPSVPASLRTTALASGRVDLAWNAATDAESGIAGYRVYRGATLLGQVTTLTYADTNVVPGATYSYTVAAVNGVSLVSAASSPLPVTTPADTTAPSVPTALAGSAASSSSISLTWTASTDNVAVASYRVYRNGALVGSPAGTGFTDTGLAADTTYAYRVAAVDTAGIASAQCTAINVPTPFVDLEKPSVPTGLTSGAVSTATVALSWNVSGDNVGVTGYLVYRNGGATPVGTPTEASYTDSGLSASTTYSYRVAARDAAGNISDLSSAIAPRTSDPSAQEYTVTLTGPAVIEDTFLFANAPSTNYGATSYLGTTDRFLIRFTLPAAMAGRRIVSAQVAFYVWAQANYQADQYMDLYRVTRPWSEAQATWNLAATGTPWATPGAANVAGDRAELVGRILHGQGAANWDHVYYPAVNVTALVQEWVAGTVPNNGLLLVNASATQIGLKASEYSPGPRLVITYTDEPAPSTYEQWVHSRFTDAQLADPALEATVWGRNADPDGDGTINLFERALGSDPSAAGEGVQCALCCEPASGGALDLTFRRSTGATGVGYVLERSLDLVGWAVVPVGDRTEVVVAAGGGMEDVVWRVQLPAGQARAFYRLRLTAQ